ncbi:MAG TPA: hypothetical protein VHU83_06360 [Bryobacteraceae bacterium]|nr:hypothetical protein [Bryobacteraceae bacterium]
MSSTLRSRGEVTRKWLAAYDARQKRQRRRQRTRDGFPNAQAAQLYTEAEAARRANDEYFDNLSAVRQRLLGRTGQ